MNCAEIEQLICDYVDGTLTTAQKAQVNLHLSACPECAQLARDSAVAVRFIERTADVEPPPELVTKIIFDAPWRKNKPTIVGVRGRLSSVAAPRAATEIRDGSGDDDSLVLAAFEIHAATSIEGFGLRAEGSLGRTGKPGTGCLGQDREVL